MRPLRPFWYYFGGKWASALRYPPPTRSHIVEPFAGAAGYALRYAHLDVTLVDRYPVVCEVWRWLIGSSPADVRAIPCVEHVDALPSWVPEGARYLVGFSMNAGVTSPRRAVSAGRRRSAATGRRFEWWNEARRERTASQVDAIKHWRVIEGDYSSAPDVNATWFVDPPYVGQGKHYVHGSGAIDFDALGAWCMSRRGQVIACENDGATWLPFAPSFTARSMNRRAHAEAVWTQETA